MVCRWGGEAHTGFVYAAAKNGRIYVASGDGSGVESERVGGGDSNAGGASEGERD